MRRYALLGEKLGHSLSPNLHKSIYRQLEIDDASYRSVELSGDGLKSFFSGFRVGGFDGVNITIPHKSTVIPLLDEVEQKAKLLNAVNCINRQSNKLVGYNTDVQGFDYTLRKNSIEIENNNFVIVGAGGAAQAVAAVLAEGNAKNIFIVNRTPEKAEILKKLIAEINSEASTKIVEAAQLNELSIDCVVNTTSLGMHPDIKDQPIRDFEFSDNMVAIDLIYNPLQTKFLKTAAKQGATPINGIQMLVAQAVYSLEIWMGGNIVAHVDMAALVRDLEKNFK